MKFYPALILIAFLSLKSQASTDSIAIVSIDSLLPTLIISPSDDLIVKDSLATDSILNKKELRKQKLVAAIAAFPFPLGFMGAHRVVLGTKPWIPVVYVATFGGVFGILPLIDFCVIVFSKDLEKYKNNPHVFMWIK